MHNNKTHGSARRPRGWRALHRSASGGFTLTEMLIVLVIISILAAIAYPSYREAAAKTRRKDALTSLLREASNMERCFSRFHEYDNAAATCAGRYPLTTPEGFYTITLASDNTTYTLTATPPVGGAQLNDVADGVNCGAGMTLDQTGARGPANCW